jgi:hypothetical protein
LSYSVHFAFDLAIVPDEVRRQIEKTMQQIAEVVSTVPATSPFWSSMKDSVLHIDVEGWRLGYRIEPARSEIRVVEIEKLRRG